MSIQSKIKPIKQPRIIGPQAQNTSDGKKTKKRQELPHIFPPGFDPTENKDPNDAEPYNNVQSSRVKSKNPTSYDSSIRSEFDILLEEFLTLASTKPLVNAIETFFQKKYDAKRVIYWEEVPDLDILFSSTYNLTCPHSSGLVGYSVYSRSIIKTSNPASHPSFEAQTDGKVCQLNMPILIFPLWNHHNSICGIVEIVRSVNCSEFSVRDEEFVHFFSQRFKIEELIT